VANSLSSPTRIPLLRPFYYGEVLPKIEAILQSGQLVAGPYRQKMEQRLADYLGTPAAAVSSGTAALHLALLAIGVGRGDEVLVPSLTFVATANAVRYCGARPMFIDAHPLYGTMNYLALIKFLEERCINIRGATMDRATGLHVKAIIPVHVFGSPADMYWFRTIAADHHLTVVEDCAQALGSSYMEKPLGSVGDISCFSFNATKTVASGGGGAVATNNPEWLEKVRYLANQAKDSPEEYIHSAVGYNYHIAEVDAALIETQLEILDWAVARKIEMAERYDRLLADNVVMPRPPWGLTVPWLYTIRVPSHRRQPLLERLKEENIEARRLWEPLHISQGNSFTPRCLVAESWYAEGVSLPSSLAITYEEQERVAEVVKEVLHFD